jgi:hypothetical protein
MWDIPRKRRSTSFFSVILPSPDFLETLTGNEETGMGKWRDGKVERRKAGEMGKYEGCESGRHGKWETWKVGEKREEGSYLKKFSSFKRMFQPQTMNPTPSTSQIFSLFFHGRRQFTAHHRQRPA